MWDRQIGADDFVRAAADRYARELWKAAVVLERDHHSPTSGIGGL